MKINLEKIKKVHLVGIGGIGVSAIARLLHKKDIQVSGSDLVRSKITNSLKKLGVKVYIGQHGPENIERDIDLVVHTVAVPKDNPELIQAKKFKIPILTFPQILGELTKNKFTIAVSGTHGKTTTTSLASLVLEKGGFDPTVVIGSNLETFKGNAKVGKSKYFVIEADEYRKAFLNYLPNIIVLTSLEYEHPDCYKNLKAVKQAFNDFLKKLPARGMVIACFDDANVRDLIEKSKAYSESSRRVMSYGFSEDVTFRIGNVIQKRRGTTFQITKNNELIGQFKLIIPGIHNVLNATAAIALALELGISIGAIKKALAGFKGAWRRFEKKGEIKGVTIIDDYAHHPTEVQATLAAARKLLGDRKIICVFQPHHYQRTKALFDDFVKSFSNADEIVIPDIYSVAGREDKLTEREVSSKMLVEEIAKLGEDVKYIGELDEVVKYLAEHTKKEDVVITMGAGDVTEVGDKLLKRLKKKN